MAQATHGSAPDIAGKGIANPYAMIMSGQMLLAWLGHKHGEPKAVEAADVMERAIEHVIREAKTLTPDLGGKASTSEMGDAIAAAVGSVERLATLRILSAGAAQAVTERIIEASGAIRAATSPQISARSAR